jgi:multidrug efflux pump subunit AcrA (membrane-fusion protein)
VVDADNVVQQRYVTLGQTVDQLRVIKDGLQADDLVIVNGLMRARPGQRVTPEASPAGKISPQASAN